MESSFDFISALEKGDLKLVSLADINEIKPFDCGIIDLNNFLINDAKIYQDSLSFTTILLETDNKTVAFYSLANDKLTISVNTDREFKKQVRELMKTKPYLRMMLNETMFPAAKIGRLGVDLAYQRLGIGTFILEALTHSFISKNKTGCQFLTVDSLNNACALKFYEKNGFDFLTINDVQKESRQMYKCLLKYV